MSKLLANKTLKINRMKINFIYNFVHCVTKPIRNIRTTRSEGVTSGHIIVLILEDYEFDFC